MDDRQVELIQRLLTAAHLVRQAQDGDDEPWTDAHDALYAVLDEIEADMLRRGV